MFAGPFCDLCVNMISIYLYYYFIEFFVENDWIILTFRIRHMALFTLQFICSHH